MALFHFFLLLGNSPLYIHIHTYMCVSYIYVCVCVCVCVYHIFFIHSSVYGHLGCFQVLAIVNSAAINTGIHVSYWIRVFSGYIARTGIAGSYGNYIFSFLGTSILSSIVAVPISIPINSIRGFLFLHTSPAFLYTHIETSEREIKETTPFVMYQKNKMPKNKST